MIDVGSVVNGKYRIVRTLGDGGMGSVYEAQHAVLGTRVAIKVLHPELVRRSGLVERFLQEARVVAQIRSANVVQVIDVDRTAEGHAYIVMELLDGEPLSGVLDRQRRLPVPLACEYTSQILSALEAAHALGVIHRDLKPENVIVTYAGNRPVLKLIDFGIAKARRLDPNQRNLTVAGVVMGTAEYMAPEQARSAESVDARADVYAVGVMLYEMVAGVRPVRGDSGEDARVIALKVERGEVVPLVQAAPGAPRELAGLVHHAMAARPEMRFASAAEMRLALEAASGRRFEPSRASAPSGTHPSAHPSAIATPKIVTQETPMAQFGPKGTTISGPPSEPRVDTVRAPPLATALVMPSYSGTGAPAVAAVLPSGGDSQVHGAHGRGSSSGRTAALVALPVLFGASVAGILIGTGTWTPSSSTPSGPPQPAPLEPAQATATVPSSAGGAPPPSIAVVPTLTPARQVGPSARPAPSVRAFAVIEADAGAFLNAMPNGLPSALPTALPSGLPLPAGFPTALPSGFPTALPSGFPTAIPGFPTALPSGFPTVLPAWPAPPSATAAPPPAPAHSASDPPQGF